MDIRIRIGRVVVEGGSRADADATAAAFRAELAHAIGAHGLPAGWLGGGQRDAAASPPRIEPGPAAATPAGRGRQAARRLVRP